MSILNVGDRFRASLPMSERGEEWEVEHVGRYEAKLSGIWYRLHQIERWIATGKLVKTERESARSNDAEYQ